jgi:hypothetical protein
LLANRLKIGEEAAKVLGRSVKGDWVVIERDLEMKEVDGEAMALNTERRRECLQESELLILKLRILHCTYMMAD